MSTGFPRDSGCAASARKDVAQRLANCWALLAKAHNNATANPGPTPSERPISLEQRLRLYFIVQTFEFEGFPEVESIETLHGDDWATAPHLARDPRHIPSQQARSRIDGHRHGATNVPQGLALETVPGGMRLN